MRLRAPKTPKENDSQSSLGEVVDVDSDEEGADFSEQMELKAREDPYGGVHLVPSCSSNGAHLEGGSGEGVCKSVKLDPDMPADEVQRRIAELQPFGAM